MCAIAVGLTDEVTDRPAGRQVRGPRFAGYLFLNGGGLREPLQHRTRQHEGALPAFTWLGNAADADSEELAPGEHIQRSDPRVSNPECFVSNVWHGLGVIFRLAARSRPGPGAPLALPLKSIDPERARGIRALGRRHRHRQTDPSRRGTERIETLRQGELRIRHAAAFHSRDSCALDLLDFVGGEQLAGVRLLNGARSPAPGRCAYRGGRPGHECDDEQRC